MLPHPVLKTHPHIVVSVCVLCCRSNVGIHPHTRQLSCKLYLDPEMSGCLVLPEPWCEHHFFYRASSSLVKAMCVPEVAVKFGSRMRFTV